MEPIGFKEYMKLQFHSINLQHNYILNSKFKSEICKNQKFRFQKMKNEFSNKIKIEILLIVLPALRLE